MAPRGKSYLESEMAVSRKLRGTSLIVGATLALAGTSVHAGIWNLPADGSWNTAANWNPAAVPNGVGANATFNNAASANNPAQTASRTITADGAQTVGSIVFNNDAA